MQQAGNKASNADVAPAGRKLAVCVRYVDPLFLVLAALGALALGAVMVIDQGDTTCGPAVVAVRGVRVLAQGCR